MRKGGRNSLSHGTAGSRTSVGRKRGGLVMAAGFAGSEAMDCIEAVNWQDWRLMPFRSARTTIPAVYADRSGEQQQSRGRTSAPSRLDFQVKELEFSAGVFDLHLPIDTALPTNPFVAQSVPTHSREVGEEGSQLRGHVAFRLCLYLLLSSRGSGIGS
jgi:hypothetical protein